VEGSFAPYHPLFDLVQKFELEADTLTFCDGVQRFYGIHEGHLIEVHLKSDESGQSYTFPPGFKVRLPSSVRGFEALAVSPLSGEVTSNVNVAVMTRADLTWHTHFYSSTSGEWAGPVPCRHLSKVYPAEQGRFLLAGRGDDLTYKLSILQPEVKDGKSVITAVPGPQINSVWTRFIDDYVVVKRPKRTAIIRYSVSAEEWQIKILD
jgi:hypothetical protein